MTTGTPWIFWTGLGLGVLGLGLVLWSLAGDAVRHARWGRPRRCPRCWYSMEGVPGLTCPECGTAARDERALRRSRRRWGRAGVGLAVVLAASPAVCNGPLRRLNWVAYLPSDLLLTLVRNPVPATTWGAQGGPSTPGGPADREMWSRYARGGLSLGVRRALCAKQFPPGAPPVLISTRAHWPEGVPVVVEVTGRFAGLLPREFRATTGYPGGEPVVACDGGLRYWKRGWGQGAWGETLTWDAGRQVVGVPPAGSAGIVLNAEVREGGRVVWSGPVSFPTKIGGTIDEVIEPVRSPAIDAALRKAAAESLRLSGDGLWMSLRTPDLEELLGVTVAMRVEVMEGTRVAAWATLMWTTDEARRRWAAALRELPRGDERYEGWVARLTATGMVGGDRGCLNATGNEFAWAVRCRGDGAAALADPLASRSWAGEFTLPIGALRRGEERPPIPAAPDP